MAFKCITVTSRKTKHKFRKITIHCYFPNFHGNNSNELIQTGFISLAPYSVHIRGLPSSECFETVLGMNKITPTPPHPLKIKKNSKKKFLL